MAEELSLWRFPRTPLIGLFMTALLAVDEPSLEFEVMATSKVRTRLHVAGCIASCKISLLAMVGIIHDHTAVRHVAVNPETLHAL